MTAPDPPRRDTLFPGEPDARPGPGAYGDAKRKGDYSDVRCACCGVAIAEHTADCPRHPYVRAAAAAEAAPPVAHPDTFTAFSAANRARCESPRGFNHALDSWSLSDWITAVVGELGEAANLAKKLNRVRDGIPGNKETEAELRAKFRAEIGDTFVYLDLLAQSAGFSLAEAARDVFDRKSALIGYVPQEPGP